MAQGTFSAQRNISQQQQQSNLTRTQRKLEQQRKEKFERGRTEAERLRTEEFVEKEVQETYDYYIPRRYLDKHGNPTREWNRKSEHNKRAVIRNTKQKDLVKFTGTRTVKDPFTFEEYGQEYQKLDPNVQQFFLSPTEITTEKNKNIQVQKDILQSKISLIQVKIDEKRKKMQEYEARFRSYSRSQRDRKRKSYEKKMEDYERDIEEYEDLIRYASKEEEKIDKGATADDIYSYAKDKADYDRDKSEAKSKSKQDYEIALAKGELDDIIQEKLVTRKEGLSYDEYQRRVETYNKNVQQLQSRIKSVGFEKLTPMEKMRVNQSAMLWQEQYPTEQLKFDKTGNVVGIISGTFGGKEYSVTDYDTQIKKINTEREKQSQMTTDAINYLEQTGFTEGVSLEKPKDSVWQNIWSGLKTLKFASIFGTSTPIAEREQKETTALREERTREALIPQLSSLGLPEIPLYKLGTLPIKTAWEKVEYQEQLNYEQKQTTELLKELEVYSRGGGRTDFNQELTPFIRAEGLKKLKEKGVEMEEISTGFYADEFGVLQAEKTIVITDPSFDRKMSQNLLEWEGELKKDESIDKGIWQQLKPTSINKLLLETRIFSTKATETYMLMTGIKLGVIGLVSGYKALGLPTIQLYKAIELQEATALVPRTYKTLKIAGTLALTGFIGYGKYKQYQSYKSVSGAGASLFWLETSGELAGFEASTHIVQNTFNKAYNRIKNWNLQTRTQADVSMKGFLRENPRLPSGQERIYIERYQGFKLSKPKSWLQWGKGYEKGQFTGRAYKLVPDEVMAYYKYKGDVFLYKKGATQTPENLIRIIKAEPFPFDVGATHLKWFKGKNIEEYGLGKYSDLPIDVKKKYSGFGYSATGEAWKGTEFSPDIISYYDASGTLKTLHTAGAIQYVSGKGVSVGFLRVFSTSAYEELFGKTAKDPVIYADYFKDVKLNKALKEIKGIGLTGRELKAFIYKYNVGSAGTLNIGRLKKEVEGTTEIATRIPIREQFAGIFAGWKVPFKEQILASASSLSSAEVSAITRSIGAVTELSGTAYSSIPASSSAIFPFLSIMSYPSKSQSYSRVMSDISKISDISRVSSKLSDLSAISKPSRVSRVSSDLSYSSLISDIMSKVSYSPTPQKSSVFKPFGWDIGLKGKEKLKKKLRRTPEIMGLFPDFTSRALGLAPKEVSLKQALKDIEKLQSGFEIRTGARLKGMKTTKFKPINEKELMKGVIKW